MDVFDYTSGKIKMVAKIYFWGVSSLVTLLLFIGFVAGIAYRSVGGALLCFFMIPICVFAIWSSALMMYGFGRIVDNTDEIRYQLEQLDKRKDTQH